MSDIVTTAKPGFDFSPAHIGSLIRKSDLGLAIGENSGQGATIANVAEQRRHTAIERGCVWSQPLGGT